MGGSQAGQMLVGNVAGTPVSQMFVGNMTGSPTGGQMLVGNIAAGGASGVASANTGGGPTPPGKMIVGNIGPTPPAGAAGSATSPAAAGQMIVGGATAAAAGQAGTHQLLLSSGSGQLMVGPGQLPVVIPSTSSSLSSQVHTFFALRYLYRSLVNHAEGFTDINRDKPKGQWIKAKILAVIF